jgi:hypothetical protein
MFENFAVLGGLGLVFHVANLPASVETLGWVLSIFAAHSAESHAGRKAEKAGQQADWLSDSFKWLGALGVVLAANSPSRALVLVPLARAVLFAVWRTTYRRRHPPRPRVRQVVPRSAKYSTLTGQWTIEGQAHPEFLSRNGRDI